MTPKTASVPAIAYHSLQHDSDLDILIKDIGDAEVVLLGESTHGTREFYQWRDAISRKLAREKGFNIIAIEGDWWDALRIDDYIRTDINKHDSAIAVLETFRRWPSTMWGNREMIPFVEWLKTENLLRVPDSRIRFYGLDLYAFWNWTRDINTTDTLINNAIRRTNEFFTPFRDDALVYGDWIRKGGLPGTPVVRDLLNAVSNQNKKRTLSADSAFLVSQLALLTKNGEEYFRIMNDDRVKAINFRDEYMATTIQRLLAHHGKKAKLVVWLHNGHAGNARYSSSAEAGYTSVGEILKTKMGDKKIYSVGFGTYKGTVMAGYQWNGSLIPQVLPPAKTGSWEEILHRVFPGNMLLLSKEIMGLPDLNKWIEMRSVGATYSGAAIYNRSIMPKRFDAFIFIDSSSAITSLK